MGGSPSLTLPRFYKHLHKGENVEIGGDYASKHSTLVWALVARLMHGEGFGPRL